MKSYSIQPKNSNPDYTMQTHLSRRLHSGIMTILGLAIAGCTAMEPSRIKSGKLPDLHRQHMLQITEIQQFNLKGRIGVQAKGKGFSGSAEWQHANRADNIALFSPLGSQVATIKTIENGMELVTGEKKTYRAPDAETLTQEVLGWSLPVNGLADWVLGRPGQGLAQLTLWDKQGRITRLDQNGWEIEYLQYSEVKGYQLPAKINLRNQGLILKLIIKDWNME